MHLFFYSIFVASVLSINHHWDYKVQGSSETILNELVYIWQSPFPSPVPPSGYLSFETFLYTFSEEFYKCSQSSWLPITCCKGEHSPYKAPTLQLYREESRRGGEKGELTEEDREVWRKCLLAPDLQYFYSCRKLFVIGVKGAERSLLYTQVVLNIVSVLFGGSAVVQSQGCRCVSDREVREGRWAWDCWLYYSPGVALVALFLFISHIYWSEMLKRLVRVLTGIKTRIFNFVITDNRITLVRLSLVWIRNRWKKWWVQIVQLVQMEKIKVMVAHR